MYTTQSLTPAAWLPFLGLIGCGAQLIESDKDIGASPEVTTDTGTPDAEDTAAPVQDPEDTGTPVTNDTGTPQPQTIDYRERGPHSIATSSMSLAASCTSAVEITAPTTDGDWPRVFLAHGFMRGSVQMTGWAEHLASWGVEVVRPALCHATITDTDHRENGADLTRWNDALGGGPVIYGGHSAGGLAALVAASTDADSIGMIALDLTDMDGIGASAAALIDVPTFGLAGEPSSCNSEGNGISALSRIADARLVRITDADHCDFEDETDWLCTSFCLNTSTSFSDSQIRQNILGLITSAVTSISGQDPIAESVWWQPGGTFYDPMQASGALSPL